ncbi:MAG: hypothetical protein RML40_02835 [Bacteroidota bacterium]|nr:hypothetical protein [Candidatus Kapabacteria bacterium]MDW8219446.1 hypothetical protein [Bacteroidota bacterium]
MSKEELLELYLNGSLSEVERKDIERAMQLSPLLAQEISELQTIQDMLSVLPNDNDERTIAFLRIVEDNLAQAIVTVGAATTAAAIATTQTGTSVGVTGASGTAGNSIATWLQSIVSGALSSAKGIILTIGVGAVVGGAAIATYIHTTTSRNEQSAYERQQAPPNASTRKRDDVALPDAASIQRSSPSHAASTAAGTRQSSAASRPVADARAEGRTSATGDDQSAVRPRSREYTARISSSAYARYEAAVLEYKKQLQEKEASNDVLGVAFVSKSLGVLLRQMGRTQESRRYLTITLQIAQQHNLRELEGEAQAELALLDAHEGNKERSIEGMRSAIVILNTVKSMSASRWQKELDRLLKQ